MLFSHVFFLPAFWGDVIVFCAFNKFQTEIWEKSGAQTGNDVPNQMEMDKEKYDGNRSKKGTCRSLNQPIPEKYPADEKMVP